MLFYIYILRLLNNKMPLKKYSRNRNEMRELADLFGERVTLWYE